MKVNRFRGQRDATAGAGIEANEFQIDAGSDRYKKGSWARRRGMARAATEKLDGPVTSILGWDLPGVEFAYLVVAGTEIHGFSSVLP